MEPKDFSTINLTQKEIKDIQQFCNLNKIEDIPTFLHTCAWKGYEVEKFGILGKTGGIQEKRVEIEVIREKRVEIPVEVIKEVIKVEYVEVPVEVIKEVTVDKIVEVIKEVPVEKIVTIYDNSSENELFGKIEQLEQNIFHLNEQIESERKIFSTKIEEMEKIFQDRPKVDDSKTQQLQQTIQNLMTKLREKDKEITELNDKINNITVKNEQDKPAVYLRSSNLNDNLYKD